MEVIGPENCGVSCTLCCALRQQKFVDRDPVAHPMSYCRRENGRHVWNLFRQGGMNVNLAHLRERSHSGGWINFAVFDVRSSSGTREDNTRLLAQLTAKACDLQQ